jgi:hypothetical protein
MSVVEDLRYGNTVTWCSYFWSTIGAMAKVLWLTNLTIVGTIFLSLFVLGMVNMITFLVTGVLGYPVAWVDYEMAMVFVALTTIMTTLLGFGFVSEGDMKVVPSYLKFEGDIEPKNGKQPSFFYTAYNSWKDKFCPLVELEK